MIDVSPPEPPAPSSRDAVRGMFWMYLSFLGGKSLNFVTTMILASLLVPEQVGLVGYCTIAIQYLDILNTAGINSALIARKDKVEEAANASFTSSIALGIFSFGIAWVTAPAIALFFKSPEVTDLFRLLALSLPINGLGQVPDALLQRGLQFKKKLIPDFVRNLVKGLVSIILAIAGYGPWSLVWGQLAGETTATLISWILAGWLPSRKYDHKVSMETFSFGGHIIVIEFAGALRNNVDYIIVGRVLGAAALGLYTMAYRIPELIIRSFNNVVGKVSFPILSKVQTDIAGLRAIYFVYVRYIALLTFALGFGLALVSFPFVNTFLSADWQAAAMPMVLISVALTISSIGYVPGVLYKAIQRPEVLGRLTLGKLPVLIVILIIGTRWGIVGVATGQVFFAIFSLVLDCIIIKRVIGFGYWNTLQAVSPALAASASMAVFVLAFQAIFQLSNLTTLVGSILVGGFGYVTGIAVVDRKIFIQSLTTLRHALPVKSS